MPLRLASFNVNSIRKRAGAVRRFLDRAQPDLLLLQALKCRTEEVPSAELEGGGWRVHALGQPGGRNGVAVIGRIPFEVVAEGLPGEPEDSQARYVEVAAAGLRVGGLYLPNGNSGGAEGFAYKLRWMDRLRALAAARLDAFQPLALLGDFNVCPTALDLAPGTLPETDALVHPEVRARWRALEHLGLTDALRALHPDERVYTYWDHGSAFERNAGLRIDHALLSAELAERLSGAVVDTAPRAEDQPSDHTPVIVELRD
jgi:exodeoxyribonuclease-3